MTTNPYRFSSRSGTIDISPRMACIKMLRAISETAVAIKVASVLEKPKESAKLLTSARATTMSCSDRMEMAMSSLILSVPLNPAL
jgi:hypothetical protein